MPYLPVATRHASLASPTQSAAGSVTSIHPFMTRPRTGLNGLPTPSATSATAARR